jgi:DNA-binding GntR family transcriptional regulator
VLDYIKILRLSYGKKINGREIAETQGCDKTTINDFLRKFKESEEFSYPLAPTVTN